MLDYQQLRRVCPTRQGPAAAGQTGGLTWLALHPSLKGLYSRSIVCLPPAALVDPLGVPQVPVAALRRPGPPAPPASPDYAHQCRWHHRVLSL